MRKPWINILSCIFCSARTHKGVGMCSRLTVTKGLKWYGCITFHINTVRRYITNIQSLSHQLHNHVY
ncbi:hypothetical protein AQUCO_01300223v1 [Aquilegia coerulea]|uniref:Uncharacterized protein n=1 Tax=Aquilegia coerulea TaxID=218851 RepID=A0A2G5E120_AQUCA|nr:hypothetical protein AQUCO_01300223v1 [Aquilegia coerulea]